jgi:hypothetical protein
MDYEFTAEQNRILSGVATDVGRAGKAILAAGVLTAIYIVLTFLDPQELVAVSETGRAFLSAVDSILWIIIAIIVIYVSITVLRMAIPLKLIATTSGKDISHVMEFVQELGRVCRVCFKCVIAICVLLGASLSLAIAVF